MSLLPAKNSAFVSNAFLIFLSRFFPSLANLGVILWFSHLLPRDVYGGYTHFWIHLNLLAPIACFGLHVVAITYSPEKLSALRASITRTAFGGFLVWCILWSVVFAVLQSGFKGSTALVPFLYFGVFVWVTVLESVLIVHRRFSWIVPVNFLYSILFLALHFFYGRANAIPVPLFTLLLLTLVGKLAVYVIAISRIGNPSEMAVIPSPEIKKIRSLWLHLAVYDITQTLYTWVDKFLVSLLLSAGLSAMYYNGTVNIPFLPLLINAAGSAILLQLPSGTGREDHSDLLHLLNHTGRLLSCLVFPLFAFLFFFREDLIRFLFSDQYSDAVPVFAMSILILPLRAYSFTTVLQRHHKGRLLNIGSLADLALSCMLMYPLYRWMGLPGLAFAFVVTNYLLGVYYISASAHVLKTRFFSLIPIVNWIVKLAVFSVVFYLLHSWMTAKNFTAAIKLLSGGTMLVLSMLVALLIDRRLVRKEQV